MAHFEDVVGLRFLRGLHLNDSKGDVGCGLDRHENIGKGRIGLECFRWIVNDPRLRGIPMILETPSDHDDLDAAIAAYRAEIALLRSLAGVVSSPASGIASGTKDKARQGQRSGAIGAALLAKKRAREDEGEGDDVADTGLVASGTMLAVGDGCQCERSSDDNEGAASVCTSPQPRVTSPRRRSGSGKATRAQAAVVVEEFGAVVVVSPASGAAAARGSAERARSVSGVKAAPFAHRLTRRQALATLDA